MKHSHLPSFLISLLLPKVVKVVNFRGGLCGTRLSAAGITCEAYYQNVTGLGRDGLDHVDDESAVCVHGGEDAS